MILASFSLSFFTSIPGMLITGGVLLLLIALIIFIATGTKGDKKKDKKKEEAKVDSNQEVMATPSVDTPIATVDISSANVASTPSAVNSVGSEAPNVVPTGDVNVDANPGVTPQVVSEPMKQNVSPLDNTSNLNINDNNSNVNGIDNINNVNPSVTNLDNNFATNNVVNKVVDEVPAAAPSPSVVEPQVSSSPTVMEEAVTNNMNNSNLASASVAAEPAVSPINNTTVTQSEVVPIVTQEPTVPKEEEHKPIYGGVSSVIPNINVEENHHRPIYGGANPLENTQSIPTVSAATPVTPNVSIPSVEPQSPVINEGVTSQPVKEEPSVVMPTVSNENATSQTPDTTVTSNVTNNASNDDQVIESLF